MVHSSHCARISYPDKFPVGAFMIEAYEAIVVAIEQAVVLDA